MKWILKLRGALEGRPTRLLGRSQRIGRALPLLLLVVASSAHATDPVPLPKMKAFLAKNRPCYVWAVGAFDTGPFINFTSGEVFCIFDGVTGGGTLSEQKGCMVAKYVPEDNTYDTEPMGVPLWIERACSPEVVGAFFEAGSVKDRVFDVLGMCVGGNKMVLGGAEPGLHAMERALCKNVPGLQDIDCKAVADAEAAAAVAGKKGAKPQATRPREDRPAKNAK